MADEEYLPESLDELRKLVEHIIVLQGGLAAPLAARKIVEAEEVERKARELKSLIERQFDAYRRSETKRPSLTSRNRCTELRS